METNHLMLTQIVPESIDLLRKRLLILNEISQYRFIGRRALAQKLPFSERVIRAELEVLKEQQLIIFTSKGVSLTDTCRQRLSKFNTLMITNEPLEKLANILEKRYSLKKCIVVKGDSDKDDSVAQNMGKALTQLLDELLPHGKIILSVSGGTTISKVMQSIDSTLSIKRQFTIIPARGGGRGELAIEANTVGHELAKRLSGQYDALFVPEQISQTSLTLLMNDPIIAQTLNTLKQSNCLIYSVGNAKIMAERRGAQKDEIDIISKGHAVGEALGTFFDSNGHVVYRLARLGLELQDLSSLPCEVLVVGGSNKKKAVSAYMKLVSNNTCVVIDEALANLVLKEETL